MLSTRHPRPHLPSTLTLLASALLTIAPRPILAQDDGDGQDVFGLGDGGSGSGQFSNPPGTPAPQPSSNRNTLYLIVLVVLVLIAIGITALLIARRRKAALARSRSRAVADMEAARGQRALTNWRHTGSWHAGTVGDAAIPLSPTSGAGARNVRGGGRPPRRVEGLNEEGEAPPPYAPPAKDASKEFYGVARRDSGSTAEDETVVGSPADASVPKYEEAELARPEPAHRPGDKDQGQ